ncbi:MAG TPA: Ig-like domain-containing protein, partial [Candidatus Dormibacteraeota bacterium]
MMDDPELHELFGDPADREVVDLLKASRPAAPPLDPHFRNYLRAKLMAEARETLGAPTRRRWFQLGPVGMAPAMAAVAAGFLIVLAIQVYLHGQATTSPPVAVNLTGIQDRKDVATAEPIHIPFTGPVDKTAVEESIVMQPATSFTKHWEGQTLVITPSHPLAPSTSYKVTLQPKAKPPSQPAATPQPVQRPVIVHFLTVPAPVPPVVPPSFKSNSVTYGYDNRIPDSARLSNSVWTLDGQLLVTRPADPAGPTASSTASASAAQTPAASAAAATNVWLLSTQGTLIRNVAPGGSYPAVAPSGGVFADWQQAADHASLEVRDLQGNVQTKGIATLGSRPDRAPVWLGAARLAYLDEGGLLRIVDLHGTLIATPALKVAGSMAASRNGQSLAVVTDGGPVVLDLGTMTSTPLPAGAEAFA